MKALKTLVFTLFATIPLLASAQFTYLPKKPLIQVRNKLAHKKQTQHLHKIITKRNCYTQQMDSILRAKYDLPSTQEFELQMSQYKKQLYKLTSADSVFIIPVIVHVVHNGEAIGEGGNISAEQVASQIRILNEDFRKKSSTPGFNDHPDGADTKIQFALAIRDEKGNPLTERGIHRVNGNQEFWETDDIETNLKPQTIWDPKQYLNIWTVTLGGEDDDILGYAQFPSLSRLSGINTNGGLASTDGVVIRHQSFGEGGSSTPPYNHGRTTTHEVGHWLGLRHIWGDGDCSRDDFCEDTPPASDPNYKCEPNNSCEEDEKDDMIENYMDYTPDECMNIFTNDQNDRMQTVLLNSPRRKELRNSNVYAETTIPIAYFSLSQTGICAGETIQLSDNSINKPNKWLWNIYDTGNSIVLSDSIQDPIFTFPAAGLYSIELIVSNPSGQDTLKEKNVIFVLSDSSLSVPFNESFEFTSVLENWLVYNPDGDRTWTDISKASSDAGSWSFFMDNYSTYDDPTGTVDAFISPSIDFTASQNAYLTFDYAYARFSGEYTDTLVILVTTDCGETFTPIWSKEDKELATAPDTEYEFIPNTNEWETVRISLQKFNTFSEAHLSFLNFSGWGNNLYIDSLNLIVPSYTTAPIAAFETKRDTLSQGLWTSFSDKSTHYPTHWEWEFEGGTPSFDSTQFPVIRYDSTGTYLVKLKVRNPAGADSTLDSNYITVIPKPIIEVDTISIAKSVCGIDSITFLAKGAYRYEWYDERGSIISTSDTLTLYPALSKHFKVIGYDRYGGEGFLEDSLYLFNPIESILGDFKVITIADSIVYDLTLELSDFDKIIWSTGSIDPFTTLYGETLGAGSHDISLTVTDTNNCEFTDFVRIEVTVINNLDELTTNEIAIYPNPTSGYTTIKTQTEIRNLMLYNSVGEIVLQKVIFSNNTNLDLGLLPPGIYFLVLSNRDNQLVRKPILVHK